MTEVTGGADVARLVPGVEIFDGIFSSAKIAIMSEPEAWRETLRRLLEKWAKGAEREVLRGKLAEAQGQDEVPDGNGYLSHRTVVSGTRQTTRRS